MVAPCVGELTMGTNAIDKTVGKKPFGFIFCYLRNNVRCFFVLLVAIRTMQLHLRVNGSESVGEHFVENILRNSKPLINY